MVFLKDKGKRIEDLGNCERWEISQVHALPGRCIGSLLKDWAKNASARWGQGAEAQIREALGEWERHLPSSPQDTDWLPVALQIRTFEVITDLFLEGDLLRLEETMWEDLMRGSRPSALRLLRMTGPNVLLRQAAGFHPKMYDEGRLDVKVGWGQADLSLSGAAFFGNPTWRLLQLFALRFLLRMTERKEVELVGFPVAEDGFQVRVRWS
ncbi:MAG: hypothetical protein H6728_16815 [Myxococcales bacterium]|nr:hypothetical protein [Myxococcales bacterium]